MDSASPSSGARVFERRFQAVSLLKAGQGIETWSGTDVLRQSAIVIKAAAAVTFSATAQHRLRNQARVLAEVHSPWITPPIHVGVDGPLLYTVMPFVHGVPLDERLRAGPLDVRETLLVARWIVSGLGELHRRGVLHRDVKPSNVIVNQSNEGEPLRRATLIDFWMARSDRIGQSLRDQPVATVRYLSPERAGLLESNVDERSDLYSAGALLFECLAGRPLFAGATMSELVRQHISEPPPELRALGLSAPRALDGILQRLLQKDPRDRYHSAEGVLADLTAVEHALDRGEAEPTIVIGARDQRLTITEPAFTGRAAELRALGNEIELARGGQGRLVLVEAESGGGKTRLLDELALRASRDALVLRGQGVAQQAARPFQMLVSFAEQLTAMARADPDFAQAVRESLGDERAAACAALPELGAVLRAQADGGREEEAPGPEAFGEARTVTALSSLLDALGSAGRPALLILDDAQWADELTIKLLRHWGQRRRPARGCDHVTILVAFRSEEVPQGHELRQLDTATSLLLAPLGPDDIRRMAESMAGPLPENALKVAETLSGGSPFMVSAVLRGMVECGALLPAMNRWRVEPLALDDVRSSRQAAVFLGRRLERLPAPALDLLSVGAVLGKEFDLDFAAALAGQSIAAATAALEQVRRSHIVWLRGDGRRCVFVHDKLREALLERVGEAIRRGLHLKAATAIEERDRQRCFEIAYHYDAAGEPARALPYALQAGDGARARHALGVAEQQYRIAARGLEGADAATRLRVAEGLGDVLVLRGQYDQALDELG
ncbi:MAG TPA: AAA family ATPase, partial [Polyangia bacterium]|nr:AAA family ATPase [Polyangia bacterium]